MQQSSDWLRVGQRSELHVRGGRHELGHERHERKKTYKQYTHARTHARTRKKLPQEHFYVLPGRFLALEK
jgi:hypothetical protein